MTQRKLEKQFFSLCCWTINMGQGMKEINESKQTLPYIFCDLFSNILFVAVNVEVRLAESVFMHCNGENDNLF